MMLERHEPPQLLPRQPEHLAHLVVEVGSIGERGDLLSPQKLRDVGLGDLEGIGQISLVETELFQAFSDDQSEIHEVT